MKHGTAIFLSASLAVAMAGCADSSGTSVPSSPTDGPGNDFPSLDAWSTSKCTGFTSDFSWPATDPLGRPPPGWEETEPKPVSSAELLGLQCERFSFGPYERPLDILIEAHTDFNSPDSCREGQHTVRRFMERIIVNDPDVAGFLNETLRLPVVVGTLASSVETTGDVRSSNWTWSIGDGPVSYVNTIGREDQFTDSVVDITRMFWMDGDGVSYMDIGIQENSTQGPFYPQRGKLAPPMLASRVLPFYVAMGGMQDEVNIEAPLHRFRDLECREPLGA